MTVWRYTAVAVQEPDRREQRRGELAGRSAPEVRAALRRIGLQVIELRPVRAAVERASGRGAWRAVWSAASDRLDRHLRRRRKHERAELFDGLATMIASGLPLLEAIDTVISSVRQRRSALRSMLVGVREQIRGGSSLASAMGVHPAWFDGSEVAMVQAGQHGGTLPEVLRALAERQQRSGQLSQKLTAALAYPTIVALVAIGVAVFLSVSTLPALTQVLSGAGLQTPALTAKVMALGQLLAGHWPAIGLGMFAAAMLTVSASAAMASRRIQIPGWLRRLRPAVLRRMAVARLSVQLAQLLGSGVAMVEALRVLVPTASTGGLRRSILEAAERVERGEDLAAALDDELWFDTKFRRLLEIGQASGELEALLLRIGDHYTRQANRLIDRLASLLEPAVILILAVLVGVVVMAAVLPLLRLQEVI